MTELADHPVDGAERALAGASVLAPRRVLAMVALVRASDFVDSRYAAVLEAVRARFAAGLPIDAIVVADACGLDPAEIQTWMYDPLPAITCAGQYASIVRRRAQWRRALLLTDELLDAVLRGDRHDLARLAADLVRLADELEALERPA